SRTSPMTINPGTTSLKSTSAQHLETIILRSAARTAAISGRVASPLVGMLPKPTKTGGSPLSRNASRSAGRNVLSVNTHVPVWKIFRPGVADRPAGAGPAPGGGRGGGEGARPRARGAPPGRGAG